MGYVLIKLCLLMNKYGPRTHSWNHEIWSTEQPNPSLCNISVLPVSHCCFTKFLHSYLQIKSKSVEWDGAGTHEQTGITSLAMLAPIRTQQLMPSKSVMRVEIMHGPSILTSIPLMREIASTSPRVFPTSLLHMPSINWCGVTNTNMVASFTAQLVCQSEPQAIEKHPPHNKHMIGILLPACSRSGSATTFLPSFIPGRYLTFSWQIHDTLQELEHKHNTLLKK